MSHFQFPRIYSAYVAHFTEDLSLWLKAASRAEGPILELGCGPGRVLNHLSENGFKVTGLDNDPEMLNWVRSNLPSHQLDRVNLIEGDMRQFKLPQSFPLVIMPCNTFAYFKDQDGYSVLDCIRKHLTPKGQGILVVPNPDKSYAAEQAGIEDENLQDDPILDFIEPISGNPIQVYALEESHNKHKLIHVAWAFDELASDGRVQRYTHEVSYNLRSIEETISLIESAGLSLEGIFGDYQFGPVNTASEELIFMVGLGL